jgi:hypothetical protein
MTLSVRVNNVDWELMVCPMCGVEVIIRKPILQAALEMQRMVYCPNGHPSTLTKP